MKRKPLSAIFSSVYSAIVFVFMYAPIVILMVQSFNNSKSRNQWAGFTLRWYEELLSDRGLMSALRNTLVIALLSATIATIIGTFAAIGIYYMKNGLFKSSLINITYLPMLNPDIVTGISLLLFFTAMGISLGYKTLLLAHITFNIPYVVLSVMPKLKQMNPHSYEAALDLGMKPFPAICKVIIPEIKSVIASGFILGITMSIDDFIISYFTTGVGVSTLSLEIYNAAKRGISPKINALSTIMFTTVLLLLIIVNLRTRKYEKE